MKIKHGAKCETLTQKTAICIKSSTNTQRAEHSESSLHLTATDSISLGTMMLYISGDLILLLVSNNELINTCWSADISGFHGSLSSSCSALVQRLSALRIPVFSTNLNCHEAPQRKMVPDVSNAPKLFGLKLFRSKIYLLF